MRSVVLVEGRSDAAAVTTLAARLGRDLAAEGVEVVAMGGATNVRAHVARLVPTGVRLAGLYDAPEERFFRRALGVDDLAGVGFFRCEADLEEELIRALGVERVLEVVTEHGDLGAFRTLRRQPAHRDRTDAQRLRRFLGTTSGRKVEYAALLVAALPPDTLPEPLRRLLAYL